jgi:hypothetical protein
MEKSKKFKQLSFIEVNVCTKLIFYFPKNLIEIEIKIYYNLHDTEKEMIYWSSSAMLHV